MRIENDNLIAIAYKAGFCGSLLYYILALSPEVKKAKRFRQISFYDSTAHWGSENWFKNLHSFKDAENVREEDWNSYQTSESIAALAETNKVIFRSHPNVVYNLQFIENLKVIYITHSNNLLCERWAYEKIIKPDFENFITQTCQFVFKTSRISKINNVLKRHFILTNVNHDVRSLVECKEIYGDSLFNVHLDKILDKDFYHYEKLCDFLEITPIEEDFFETILTEYNDKQWKRF
jgi:hypothetical protein